MGIAGEYDRGSEKRVRDKHPMKTQPANLGAGMQESQLTVLKGGRGGLRRWRAAESSSVILA